MTELVVLALIAAVAKLWSDIGMLRRRVLELEGTQLGRRPGSTSAPEIARDAAIPLAPELPVRSPARVIRSPAMRDAPPTAQNIADPVAAAAVEHEANIPIDAASAGGGGPDRDHTHVTESVARPDPRRSWSFEDIFGRKLPIWAGGVTLAVCGFLIVKYSIDAGLLSPMIRVLGGLLFGSGLIAGAEAALRNEDRIRDARVRQALAGAGVATLYASVLVAANVYALVPPLVAFGGMALVTLLAAFLSVRFGAPSALLGLVGGLAAPALVGAGAPNVPLLAAYLALAVGGLATLGRAQRWWWLGAAALVGGFGWGLTLILTGALSFTDSLSIGAFLLLIGVALPVLLFGGERGHLIRLAGTLAATAQIAALVATGGFAMLHWGLFGLLGIASIWLSRRERPLADLPAPALATALLLIAAWTSPTAHELALVIGGAAAIFGMPAAWRLWRTDGRLSDAAAIAALSAALLAAPMFHDLGRPDAVRALLALAGGLLASGVAAFGWRTVDRVKDARFVTLIGTAAVLLAIAAAFGLPGPAIAPVWALLAGGLVLLAYYAGDRRVEVVAWSTGLATVVLLAADLNDAGGLARAFGNDNWESTLAEAAAWGIAAAMALLFVRYGRLRFATPVAASAAVLLGYVALAQLTPIVLLPLIPAIALAALGWFRRSDAATGTAGALAAAWAVQPLAVWLAGAVAAVAGVPLLVTALPSVTDAAIRLLAPGVAASLLLWRHGPASDRVRQALIAGLALMGGVAAHIGYKQLFAILDQAEFIACGLAERTLWQALLALAAIGLYRRAPRIARAIGVASFAHLAWFSLLLHNPLWSTQAVGPLPLLNLLLPLYGLGFALLWAAARVTPALPAWTVRARGWALMALILLFAASELRQLVHGSVLAQGSVDPAEDIARSIVAIVVAVGFLLWGIRQRQRDWRIASLVVMLGAVLKVFLFDVSGLDGLLRIASFAALGFSLIGIGWLYSRYLPDDINPTSASQS